jgi:hypothetical protein
MEWLVLVHKWWNQLSLGYKDISALELEFLKFDTMWGSQIFGLWFLKIFPVFVTLSITVSSL